MDSGAFDHILMSAPNGQLGHQITDATARPYSISSNPTRRPRRVSPSTGYPRSA